MPESGESQPAAELQRRVVLSTKQKLGLPVLFAIPLLALFGVFGESSSRASAEGEMIGETVTYPTRLHYRQTSTVAVEVANHSRSLIDTIRVAFDKGYLVRFAGIRFEPSETSDLSVPLLNVKPGEIRTVVVELSGEKYGRSTGRVAVKSAHDSVAATISTFVFP